MKTARALTALIAIAVLAKGAQSGTDGRAPDQGYGVPGYAAHVAKPLPDPRVIPAPPKAAQGWTPAPPLVTVHRPYY